MLDAESFSARLVDYLIELDSKGTDDTAIVYFGTEESSPVLGYEYLSKHLLIATASRSNLVGRILHVMLRIVMNATNYLEYQDILLDCIMTIVGAEHGKRAYTLSLELIVKVVALSLDIVEVDPRTNTHATAIVDGKRMSRPISNVDIWDIARLAVVFKR